MYRLMVRRDFIARHYLIGGDWGPENQENSHHFFVELVLEGDRLNEHGYLVDIVAVEDVLDRFVTTYQETVLNDHPEFSGLNPSIEHFARIAWEFIVPSVTEPTVQGATLRMWETDSAYAEYTRPVHIST